jgi:hypothetical protein
MTVRLRHGRERFFKYTSASTALKILEAGTVRYSSPLLFNDPFDVQTGLHFDFDIGSLPDKLFRRIEGLVTSPTRPNVSGRDPWGQIILDLWDRRLTRGFPRELLWETCAPSLGEMKEAIATLQMQYQQMWHDFLPRLRVFSITEERDNLLMWSHYAQWHTGAVFEFLVLPDEDNPLCVAQPVMYRSHPPSFFTEGQWIDDTLALDQLDPDTLYFAYAYVKSDVWSYEKEWRVWDLLPAKQDTLFSDYPFRPKEVGAVYLGCRMNPDHKKALLTALSQKYPTARVFEARKPADRFQLDFDAI